MAQAELRATRRALTWLAQQRSAVARRVATIGAGVVAAILVGLATVLLGTRVEKAGVVVAAFGLVGLTKLVVWVVRTSLRIVISRRRASWIDHAVHEFGAPRHELERSFTTDSD